MRSNRSGFTLVEIAVVMAIIALLAGGVIVGQSMIRTSQVRSVVSDVARYTQAIQNFRDKYNALPGDFSGATALWGTESGACPNGTGTPPQTCDGDGDGNINSYPESLRAWQHLSNAGFIDATYTGIQSGAALSVAGGVNIPRSHISGCGWTIGLLQSSLSSYGGHNITVQSGTYLALVGGGYDQQYPTCLSPEEAQGIDVKQDDGQPSNGQMIAGKLPIDLSIAMASSSWPADGAVQLQHTNVWKCTEATFWNYNTAFPDRWCNPFFFVGM